MVGWVGGGVSVGLWVGWGSFGGWGVVWVVGVLGGGGLDVVVQIRDCGSFLANGGGG